MKFRKILSVLNFNLIVEIIFNLVLTFITVITFLTIVVFLYQIRAGSIDIPVIKILILASVVTPFSYYLGVKKTYNDNLSCDQAYSKEVLEKCPELRLQYNTTRREALRSALVLHDWKNQEPLI